MPNLIPTRSPSPRGSVLLFTLVILVLLGLMGFSLMANTRTELNITQNTQQGRTAFARADSTARLGLLMGRILISGGAAGDTPCDILNTAAQMTGRPEFKIEVGTDGLCGGFKLVDVLQKNDTPTLGDMTDRYLQATGSADAPGSAFPDSPQVRLLYDGQVVGTAAMTVYSSGSITPGGSLLIPDGHNQGESSLRVYLVVSANGRLSRDPGVDAANYYSNENGATHSVVTAIYREIVVN